GFAKAPQLLSALQKNINTDMTLSDMKAIFDWGKNLPDSAIIRIALTSPSPSAAGNLLDGGSCGMGAVSQLCADDPTFSMIRRYVASVFIDPKTLGEKAPVQFANGSTNFAGLDDRVTTMLDPIGLQLNDPVLLNRFRSGDVRALARAISLIERRDESVRELEQALRPDAKTPGVAGFTGAPGTGKSTLVDAVVSLLRKKQSSVAVLATDPNSPFSGGAILGDRIRMQRHALDPKVFIRSMGARGHLGGLSLASREAIRLLGAFGFDEVILETVGVGQSELEVAGVADMTVVVMPARLGDGVPMIKAGVLESADMFAAT